MLPSNKNNNKLVIKRKIINVNKKIISIEEKIITVELIEIYFEMKNDKST